MYVIVVLMMLVGVIVAAMLGVGNLSDALAVKTCRYPAHGMTRRGSFGVSVHGVVNSVALVVPPLTSSSAPSWRCGVVFVRGGQDRRK